MGIECDGRCRPGTNGLTVGCEINVGNREDSDQYIRRASRTPHGSGRYGIGNCFIVKSAVCQGLNNTGSGTAENPVTFGELPLAVQVKVAATGWIAEQYL